MRKYFIETAQGPGEVLYFYDFWGDQTPYLSKATSCVVRVGDDTYVACSISDERLETVH